MTENHVLLPTKGLFSLMYSVSSSFAWKWSTILKCIPCIKMVGIDVEGDLEDWYNTTVFPRLVVAIYF